MPGSATKESAAEPGSVTGPGDTPPATVDGSYEIRARWTFAGPAGKRFETESGVYEIINPSVKNGSVRCLSYKVAEAADTGYPSADSVRVVLPERVRLGDYFYRVESIGAGAFLYCDSLTSVVLPERMQSIGRYAFYECTRLASVTFPAQMDSIGEQAFYRCEALTSVTLPDELQSIGDEAFSGCTSLASVTFPEKAPQLGTGLFSGCSSLTSVTLPEGMTEVTYGNFMICPALATVHLPASLEIINMACFQQCPALTAIDLPDALTVIGDGAFSESPLLTTLDFPAGMAYIGDGAFYCTGLKSITVHATTPPTIGEYTFESVPVDIPLYVPEGSLPLYRTAEYWERFTNWQGIPGSGIASPLLSECITVHRGEVHIHIIGMDEAQVYDTTGRLVLRTTETHFTLPTGTYIICIGSEAVKVTVGL